MILVPNVTVFDANLIVSGLSKFPNWKNCSLQSYNEQRCKHLSAVFVHQLYFYWDVYWYMDIIWIWICSQRPAANLLLSESANIGAHSASPMIPKQSEAARLQRLQRLQTWICLCNTTHLAKCCQESFNYLNSKINCCGCRAKSSTVLLLAFQILWKISLWTGILPQADRAQHGFTELTVYWDIVSNKI